MNQNNSYHREFDYGKNIFASNRLIFDQPEAGRVAPHAMPKTEVDKREDELNKVGKARDLLETRISKQIKDYNDKYAESDFEKDKEPFKEPLPTDLKNADEIIKRIDRILLGVYKSGEAYHSLLSPDSGNKAGNRTVELLKIRAELTNSPEIHAGERVAAINEKFLNDKWNLLWRDKPENQISVKILPKESDNTEAKKNSYIKIAAEMAIILNRYKDTGDQRFRALKQAEAQILLQIRLLSGKPAGTIIQAEMGYMKENEEVLHLRGERLFGNMENAVKKSAETKAEWEKLPLYKSIKTAFDLAKSDPEYGGLFNLEEGEISNQNKREMELLFIALMSEKTNGFREGLPIGTRNEFTEDHEENRKKFPFIYNEWLKYKGINVKAIENRQSEVNAKSANLGLTTDRTYEKIDEIIKTYKPMVDLTTTEAEYNAALAMGDCAERYEKLEGAAGKMSRNFLSYSGKNGVREQDKTAYREASESIDKYAEYFHSKKLLFDILKDEKGASAAFTYSELSRPQNLPMLVEICMKQFAQAEKMVDRPFGKGDFREHYHSTIRRFLIASVYNQGVSEYRHDADGREKYVEDMSEDNYWMLSELTKSEYFNRREVGKNMDAKHRRILLVASRANKIALNLQKSVDAQNIIKALINIKKNPPGPADEKELLKYPPVQVGRYKAIQNVAALEELQTKVASDIKNFNDFLALARKAIRDPYSKNSDSFFRKIESGDYMKENGTDILGAQDLKNFEKEVKNIELGYNLLELNNNSYLQIFERIGIRAEGLYDSYLAALKKHPDMKTDNWADLFHSKDKFTDLRNFLGEIMSNSNTQVKEDFLAVFETLRGYDGSPENLPKTRNDQMAAIAIFEMLKTAIKSEEDYRGMKARNEAEAMAKVEGMTIGDKIEVYGRSVFDMMLGPGQSWTNRAAGAVIIFGALKMAHKAWKGDDRYGKMFRGLFIAGAAELAFKHVTGRGVLEKYLGLETVAEAVSGSRKAAMIDFSSEHMEKEGITAEQHAVALYELDKVPFKDIMAWYESAREEDGAPRDPGKKDLFSKLNIDTGKIIKGVTWDKRDEGKEARRVVMQTVQQFFMYVAGKEGRHYAADGAKMLNERWVKMVDDPKYKPQYTEFGFTRTFADRLRANPKDLTWNMVFENEVDLADAKKTENKYGVPAVLEFLNGTYNGFRTWTRQSLEGPLIGYGKQFFDDLGYNAGKLKDFLGEVGEDIGTNLEFAKDEMSFMYGANKWKIRRLAGMHWELMTKGAKLPFKVIYAADQMTIPWLLKTLKGIEGIAEREEFAIIQTDLQVNSIINPDRAQELLDTPMQMDPKQNPEFNTFGVYQKGFYNAFKNREQSQKEAFSEIEERMMGPIGYYITEISLKDINVDRTTTRYTESAWFDMMAKKSQEKAKEFFSAKYQLNPDVVEKMMYRPIHTIKKTGDNPKLYEFWRMPKPESVEYELKALNKWEDYNDPNLLKHRLPFMVDPDKSFLENLKDAFAKNIDPGTRVLTGDVAKYAIQVPRAVMGIVAKAGDMIWAMVPRQYEKQAEWVKTITQREPGTEQAIDEIFTSAGDYTLAVSEFYKEPENAAVYKLMHDFAVLRGQGVYLGIFDEMKAPDYESKRLKDKPSGFLYSDLKGFLGTWTEQPKDKLPASFYTALNRLSAAEPKTN
jgi:hypothetical protein